MTFTRLIERRVRAHLPLIVAVKKYSDEIIINLQLVEVVGSSEKLEEIVTVRLLFIISPEMYNATERY